MAGAVFGVFGLSLVVAGAVLLVTGDANLKGRLHALVDGPMDPLLLFVSSYFTLLSNKAHPWKEERSEHSLRKSQKCAFAKANSIYQTSNFLFQA